MIFSNIKLEIVMAEFLIRKGPKYVFERQKSKQMENAVVVWLFPLGTTSEWRLCPKRDMGTTWGSMPAAGTLEPSSTAPRVCTGRKLAGSGARMHTKAV